MAHSGRALPGSDAASLERLRQITARIRARAAEAALPVPRRSSAAPSRPAPAVPQHWSDGPWPEDDDPGEP